MPDILYEVRIFILDAGASISSIVALIASGIYIIGRYVSSSKKHSYFFLPMLHEKSLLHNR